MDNHRIILGAINLEAADPVALGGFWAAVIGAGPSDGGNSVYLPPNGPGGFGTFFQPATVPRAEHQLAHWDPSVPWGSRAAEVERLLRFGATHKWDVLDEVPHVQWATLANTLGAITLALYLAKGDQFREISWLRLRGKLTRLSMIHWHTWAVTKNQNRYRMRHCPARSLPGAGTSVVLSSAFVSLRHIQSMRHMHIFRLKDS